MILEVGAGGDVEFHVCAQCFHFTYFVGFENVLVYQPSLEPPQKHHRLVIQRYLIKEILQTLFAVLGVLLLIFLGRHFARYLAEAASGELPAELIFRLLTTLTLSSSVLLVPFAFYIAVLLAFGRLYRDNEMTALAAAGIGSNRVLRPIGLLSLGVAALVAWLSLVVSPWAVEQGMQLREQAEAQSELSNISAGQFHEMARGQSVFYIESLSPDKKLMNRVFVKNTTPTGDDLFAANHGYQYTDAQTGDSFVVLLDGRRYEGNPGAANFRIHEYAKASVRMEPKEVHPRARKRDAQSTRALFQSDDIDDTAELQWRISMPVSALLLGLLAVLVSRTSPREGRYARLFAAILIYIIYNNLMGVAQNGLQRGTLPPALGMWWVHGLLAVVITGLAAHQYGWGYLRTRLMRVHAR